MAGALPRTRLGEAHDTSPDPVVIRGGRPVMHNKDWTCKDKDKDQAYKDKD